MRGHALCTKALPCFDGLRWLSHWTNIASMYTTSIKYNATSVEATYGWNWQFESGAPFPEFCLQRSAWWIISNEGDVAAAAAASWRVISGITPAYRIFGSERNVIASAVKASRYDARARRSMSVVAVIWFVKTPECIVRSART